MIAVDSTVVVPVEHQRVLVAERTAAVAAVVRTVAGIPGVEVEVEVEVELVGTVAVVPRQQVLAAERTVAVGIPEVAVEAVAVVVAVLGIVVELE
jgi:hypothetical protein